MNPPERKIGPRPEVKSEALESSLWRLSGVERRLEEEEGGREKRDRYPGIRLGLQGRFTLVVIGVVMVIMVGVAILELRSGIETVTLASGKLIDLRNLQGLNEWVQAVLFVMRTPVIALVASGFLLLFYTSRYVVGPLKQVGETADAITGGDLTRHLDYGVNDEIGDVVRSFNVMTRSLVRKVDQLASLNQAGNAFSQHLSLDQLGLTIRGNAREHLRPSWVGLFVYEDLDRDLAGGQEEDLRRTRSDREVPDDVLDVQQGLAARVMETEQVCGTYQGDSRIRSVEGWNGERPLPSVGFPLFSEGRAFGALALTVERRGDSFSLDDLEFLKVLASHVSVAAKNAQLYRSLEISYLDTVAALAAAVDAKDAYTRGHSERVMRNSVALAKAVGLTRSEVEMVRYSALLHDVGKIGLPTHILSTKEKLTDEEFDLVKQHPVIGYEIVRPITFLREALDGIRYHHERWDGKGYPDGLEGEKIPFMGRILALADTWDAMANDRFYRRARTPDQIIQEFLRCSETQFDPELVSVAVEVLPEATAEDRASGQKEDRS
ncbi:MAG: HD domain-containing phosphohydrolase [bacterium]